MRQIFLIITISLVAIAAACGGGPTANNSTANNAQAKTNTNVVNSAPADNSPAGTVVKPVGETTNDAPTLAPVVQAYYDALKKSDDAGARAVMSADFIKQIEDSMKDEKKTGFAKYLAADDTIPEKPMEVRNEKISGDKGVAELKGGAYLKWTPFTFVNEGGKWKLSNSSPDIDAVKQQDTKGK